MPLIPLTGRHKGCGFFMLDIQLWDLENSWEPSKETGSFDMVTGVGRGIFFDGIRNIRNRSEALFCKVFGFYLLLHRVLGRLLGPLLPWVLERRRSRIGVLEETAGSRQVKIEPRILIYPEVLVGTTVLDSLQCFPE